MMTTKGPSARKVSNIMVNSIGLRNRDVAASSSIVAGNVGSEKRAVEGKQGTIVAMSTGTVQTRKTARGFVLALGAKASEMNVDELLFDAGKRYHPQEGGYDSMLCAFADHLGDSWGKGSNVPFPKELLADRNCTSFLLAIMEKHTYHPSMTSKCCAALRTALVHHGIPTWEHTHHWPLLSEAKKKTERYLKDHHYCPKQSTEITFAAICEGTALEFDQCEDILLHTAFTVLGATGKRVDDLYEMYCSEMKKGGSSRNSK